MFDVDEYERHLATALEQLEDAATLAERGSYNSAVLHVEQAAQILFKGLLRAAGFSELTFIHGLRSLAERCRDAVGLVVDESQLGDLKRLERDYQPTRYPDALVEGTPRSAYDVSDYERSVRTVEGARKCVDAAWASLQAASKADEEDPR